MSCCRTLDAWSVLKNKDGSFRTFQRSACMPFAEAFRINAEVACIEQQSDKTILSFWAGNELIDGATQEVDTGLGKGVVKEIMNFAGIHHGADDCDREAPVAVSFGDRRATVRIRAERGLHGDNLRMEFCELE